MFSIVLALRDRCATNNGSSMQSSSSGIRIPTKIGHCLDSFDFTTAIVCGAKLNGASDGGLVVGMLVSFRSTDGRLEGKSGGLVGMVLVGVVLGWKDGDNVGDVDGAALHDTDGLDVGTPLGFGLAVGSLVFSRVACHWHDVLPIALEGTSHCKHGDSGLMNRPAGRWKYPAGQAIASHPNVFGANPFISLTVHRVGGTGPANPTSVILSLVNAVNDPRQLGIDPVILVSDVISSDSNPLSLHNDVGTAPVKEFRSKITRVNVV